MGKMFAKRMVALLATLSLLLCLPVGNAAYAKTLKGGSTSGEAVQITTDMLAQKHTVNIGWGINTVQNWYTVTPPGAGDFYIAVQKTDGFDATYIQIFQGPGAIDDAQQIATNQSVLTAHADTVDDVVVFCIYTPMPTGGEVTFSVCFDDHHVMGSTAKTVKAATCQETGVRATMCTLCGTFGAEEETPIGDHAAGEWMTLTPASCETDGMQSQMCTVCGEVVAIQAIPAGHQFGKWSIQEMPTTTAEGVQVRECSECGHVETKVIPKL